MTARKPARHAACLECGAPFVAGGIRSQSVTCSPVRQGKRKYRLSAQYKRVQRNAERVAKASVPVKRVGWLSPEESRVRLIAAARRYAE